MRTGKIQEMMCVTNTATNQRPASSIRQNPQTEIPQDSVSFKKGDTTKKGWLFLKRLGDVMQENNEFKNAFIAAIGTGIIAPIVILSAPGKGDKEDKDKKFLQALRQPLSAVFALGFQVPATYGVNALVNNLAYDKKIAVFQDEKIGELIPSEKYLKGKITKKDYKEIEAKFEEIVNGKSLKQELENEIREEYKELGLEVSDEKLAKEVKKKKKKFLYNKIAKNKLEELKAQKADDILKFGSEKFKNLTEILDIELVNEDYQSKAENYFKEEYKQLEKEAKLSTFDRAIRSIGMETKRTKLLSNKQKEFKKQKGLELLKIDKPEIFKDKEKRIKAFVESYQKDATKKFENKKFWITVVVNIMMTIASCYTLNWAHPRVNKYIENRKAEKNNNKKVEV